MNRRRWIVLALICMLSGLGWAGVRFQYYFWPKRFGIVEAGQIYRGGWQTTRVLRRILQDYQIRTVLNVACNPPEQEAAGEGALIRQLGISWHKILMPGTGLGTFEQLDEAADLLADPANRPIFIHCAAGVHRTNVSLAAYRLKYCGWSLDQALAEMKQFGFNPARDWVQAKHLRSYFEHLKGHETIPVTGDEAAAPLRGRGSRGHSLGIVLLDKLVDHRMSLRGLSSVYPPETAWAKQKIRGNPRSQIGPL